MAVQEGDHRTEISLAFPVRHTCYMKSCEAAKLMNMELYELYELGSAGPAPRPEVALDL